MIDRCVGRLIGDFNALLARAKCGENVGALKLQRGFNEVSERSWREINDATKRDIAKLAKRRRGMEP